MALAGVGGWRWTRATSTGPRRPAKRVLSSWRTRQGRQARLSYASSYAWGGWHWRGKSYGQATELFEERLALSREMSDTWWLANSLSSLALCLIPWGTLRGLPSSTNRAWISSESRATSKPRFCLNNLAMMVYSQGDLGRAAQLTEESVALFRELGSRGGVAVGLCNLGWIALLQDDLGRAADLYRESLSLSWDTGLNPLVQMALEGFACVAGAKGEAERAARLWGAAQALHETKGIPRDTDFLAEADARISAVRSGMGEEAWEEAWRKGRAMTLDEAVSYALEEGKRQAADAFFRVGEFWRDTCS